ncbi:hypothetical protein CsSME_00008399 [Camellia sinensis var. sinensis]
MKGRTKLVGAQPFLPLYHGHVSPVILSYYRGKTISLALSFRSVIPRRTLHRGIRVLLGFCYTELIKAHNITYGEASERYPAHTHRLAHER